MIIPYHGVALNSILPHDRELVDRGTSVKRIEAHIYRVLSV